MVINQNTWVRLVHTELTPEHQLTFNTLQDQINYFNSLSGINLSNFTYQRKDNILRYPSLFDEVEKFNYVIYRNDYNDQDQKYYYAYITDLKYVNNEMVEMKLETDVFQTWQFDFIYKKSFIERKHVTDDIAGNYTMIEPVATGEYINNMSYQYPINDIGYVVNVTEYDDGTPIPLTLIAGIPYAGGFFMFYEPLQMASFIEDYPESSAIVNAYLVSRKFAVKDPESAQLEYSESPVEYEWSITKPVSLNGYTPRNQKLFTFPFCYMLVSNNTGVTNTLHYEKFKSNYCDFIIRGMASAGCPIKCIPQNYGTLGLSNEEEGIMCGLFPLLNFNKDLYADWLLTNSASLNTQKQYGNILQLGGVATILARCCYSSIRWSRFYTYDRWCVICSIRWKNGTRRIKSGL